MDKKIQSSLDSIIWIDINKEEAIKRYLNRKIDPTTNIIYHMINDPPSEEQTDIIDRLKPIEEDEILIKD